MIKHISNLLLNADGHVSYGNKAVLSIYLLDITTLTNKNAAKAYHLVGRDDVVAAIYTDQDLVDRIYDLFLKDDFKAIGAALFEKLVAVLEAHCVSAPQRLQ